VIGPGKNTARRAEHAKTQEGNDERNDDFHAITALEAPGPPVSS
jgi:hypothetical protein